MTLTRWVIGMGLLALLIPLFNGLVYGWNWLSFLPGLALTITGFLFDRKIL